MEQKIVVRHKHVSAKSNQMFNYSHHIILMNRQNCHYFPKHHLKDQNVLSVPPNISVKTKNFPHLLETPMLWKTQNVMEHKMCHYSQSYQCKEQPNTSLFPAYHCKVQANVSLFTNITFQGKKFVVYPPHIPEINKHNCHQSPTYQC